MLIVIRRWGQGSNLEGSISALKFDMYKGLRSAADIHGCPRISMESMEIHGFHDNPCIFMDSVESMDAGRCLSYYGEFEGLQPLIN